MRKGKSLIGMPIVGQDDGARVGVVKDLVFDHDTDEVLALVLAEKDLFGLIDAVIVPWRYVRNLGNDFILVENSQAKMHLRDDARIKGMTNRETVLSGTQVLTAEGKHIGTLADMCIDEQSGRVIGYEVSGGFFADTLRGKKFVPAPPGLSVGKDAAIIRPEGSLQPDPHASIQALDETVDSDNSNVDTNSPPHYVP